jgi:hypothetical protein
MLKRTPEAFGRGLVDSQLRYQHGRMACAGLELSSSSYLEMDKSRRCRYLGQRPTLIRRAEQRVSQWQGALDEATRGLLCDGLADVRHGL